VSTAAPGARDRVVDRIADAVAAVRCHGQREGLAVDVDVLITDRYQAGQHGVGVEFQIESGAVFEVDFARRFRLEVTRQIQAAAEVDGQQGRQVSGLLNLLQFEQAGVDFLGAPSRVAQSGQDVAQYRRRDFLRTAVGVDPVHRQARVGGQYFKLRITH
jgi:hypothetical protein